MRDAIGQVRRFNRFYTGQIGVVGDYLSSDYSLAETRVLYELAHREQPTASAIADGLRLDRGYLSRILRRFHKDGLLVRTKYGIGESVSTDRGKTWAELTPTKLAHPSARFFIRRLDSGKLLLVNFWATWCAPCAREFPDLEATYRMYRSRNLEFVSVSVNDPEERAAVVKFLQEHHATHDNRLFATSDVYGLQAAFDPDMPAPVPYTVLLGPGGEVRYQELGELDTMKLRRAILANLPEDPQFPGHRAYWTQ